MNYLKTHWKALVLALILGSFLATCTQRAIGEPAADPLIEFLSRYNVQTDELQVVEHATLNQYFIQFDEGLVSGYLILDEHGNEIEKK